MTLFIFLILIFSFLVNSVFFFRRTLHILLGLVSLYQVAIITMFYYELEYLSLVFISVFIGGVAILFLFVILAVDIRKENKGSIFREDAALLYSTLVTFTLSACLLLYYMSDNYSFLLAKYPKNYF